MENIGDRIILNNGDIIKDIKVKLYNPYFKAKITYNDLKEVRNQTPEELILSILSADSQEWVDFNTYGGANKSKKIDKEVFERIRYRSKEDEENNYLDIHSSLSFTANGTEYIIIKYYFQSPKLKKPFGGTYFFRKQKEKWYNILPIWEINLSIMLLSFDDSKFFQIIEGKPTGEPLMDELINQVHTSKGLSLNKFYKIYDSWYTQKDTLRKNYFLDKNAWTY